jgi:hypothetical protein
MINSWKKLVYAVDQMRQLQKKGDLTNNSKLFFQRSCLEAEIDKVCAEKIAEWNVKEDLFKNTGGEREPA